MELKKKEKTKEREMTVQRWKVVGVHFNVIVNPSICETKPRGDNGGRVKNMERFCLVG